MIKQIEIKLSYPFLYKWERRTNISVITNSDSEIYFQIFSSVAWPLSAGSELEKIDGNFAAVINSDDYFLATVDRIRSFPLFYKIEDQKILVTDNISMFEKEFIFNEAAESVFKKIFCTEGSDTLLQNWKQIQPGEFIFLNKLTGYFSASKYFIFRSKLPMQKINRVELKELFLNIFKSILYKIGNKNIIVPLSGGYDSRCIIAILKELNAKNIFVYTYGTNDSFEKKIAQKVVHQLNLDWHFVEYTNELQDSFFTEKWTEFSYKNHHFTSLPNEQDFFALLYLQENKLLPKDGIVLSGYLGDYFGGNRFTFNGISADEDDQLEYYFNTRGTKFIANSVRLYEYFGLGWYMPFTANAIFDYSLHVTRKDRQIQNGYNNFLSEAFFKPLNIDFKKQTHYYQPQHFKNFLKKYMPKKIVTFIQYKKSLNRINDPNNSNYLRDKLYNVFYSDQKKFAKLGFNEIYAEYFIHHLKEKFKN
jgi:asparagine synthase (glutamine-hydrolysing)